MTLDFARSIGDNYPEYVDDELGYRYHAREVISADESNRLERIRRRDLVELDDIEARIDEPSDLDRWALARRHLQHDHLEKYFQLVESLVDGSLEHPALDYPEIFVDLARQRAQKGDLESARRIVDQVESQWPELHDAIPLLHAQMLLVAGELEEAHRAFEQALEPHEDDVDLRIETAEDFIDADAFDYARDWLDRARQLAESRDDRPSLVDIELLAAKLPETSDESDSPDLDAPSET